MSSNAESSLGAIDCPLCLTPGADLLWQNDRLRVVAVAGTDYPGYTRVVWNEHRQEMTDLSAGERNDLMAAVWLVEQAQRHYLRPEKINLAQFGNMVPHLHWHIIPRWRADSHFPEAIWACAPPRSAEQGRDWLTQKLGIEQRIDAYHAGLIAALAA